MLFSYSIKNFKSFKLEERIYFLARSYKNHKNHLIDNMVLPVISIYGPNGGGKSSIIESLFILKELVLSGNNIINHLIPLKAYVNNQNKENNNYLQGWKIEFFSNGYIYKYVLKIDLIKMSIIDEKLTKRVKDKKELIIFHRMINKELQLCKELKTKKLLFENTIGTYLYFIKSVLNFEEINIVIKEFNNIVFLDGTQPQYMRNNLITFHKFDFEYIEKNKEKYLLAFEELDINIKDMEFQKMPNGSIFLYVIKQNFFGKSTKLPLELESKGTHKLFELLTYIFKGIHNNFVFVVDELDSSLHTKILRYIIQIFIKNKNNNSSQLIYTSHDMPTLDNKLFRKDEIYFSSLNESYFSNIVSLADFDKQIRDSNSFAKLYLDGKIGYDPYIDYSLRWTNEKK